MARGILRRSLRFNKLVQAASLRWNWNVTRTMTTRPMIPPLPYQIGRTFRAQPHKPAPPPSVHVLNASTELREAQEKKQGVQYALSYVPPTGTIEQGALTIKVTGLVNAGDRQSAQVVKVQVLRSDVQTPALKSLKCTDEIVAKIYDPLYFDTIEWQAADPFTTVDSEYSHEVQAYHQMEPIWGSVVPRFYGSYSLDVPIPQKRTTRPIRMVLLEYLPGDSLKNVDPTPLSVASRQAIMESMILKKQEMNALDVLQGDFHPRNVMLNEDPQKKRYGHNIRFIDFGGASCGYLAEKGALDEISKATKPQIFGRWTIHNQPDLLVDFEDWFEGWDWDKWLREKQEAYAPSSNVSIPKHLPAR